MNVKEIEIEYINEEIIAQINKPLLKEPFVHDVLFDKENHIVKIQYELTSENYCGLSVFSALGVVLLLDYASFYSKYRKKEKQCDIIKAKLLSDQYYIDTLLMNLVQYFSTNTRLKETTFFKFNMNGFEKELEYILDDYEFELMIQKTTDEVQSCLKENGINLNKFKTLEVVFDEDDVFSIKAKDGTILTPDNIGDVLGINIELQEEVDDFLTIFTFCSVLITLLNVQKFIIPSDFPELYDALNAQEDFNDLELELKNV